MPIYEYRCKKCGFTSEQLLAKTSDVPSGCSKCGSNDLERILSATRAVINEKSSATRTRCGSGSTCCGADTPCSMPPCGEE